MVIAPPTIPSSHIFFMCYSTFSALVCIFVCIRVLCRRRYYTQLQTPFYTIFLLNSVVDVSIFVSIQLVMLPRKFNYFGLFSRMPPRYAEYTYLGTFFIRTCMNLCYIPLALNRFMAFASPVKYDRICNNKNTILMYIVLCSVAFFCLAGLMAAQLEAVCMVLPNGLIHLSGTLITVEHIVNIIITTIVCLFCLALFVGTACLARSSTVTKNTRKYSFEIRLLFYCLFTTIPLLLDNIRCWYSVLHVDLKSDLLAAEAWYFMAELSTGLQCWALLFLGSGVRKLLFAKRKRTLAPHTNKASLTLF